MTDTRVFRSPYSSKTNLARERERSDASSDSKGKDGKLGWLCVTQAVPESRDQLTEAIRLEGGSGKPSVPSFQDSTHLIIQSVRCTSRINSTRISLSFFVPLTKNSWQGETESRSWEARVSGPGSEKNDEEVRKGFKMLRSGGGEEAGTPYNVDSRLMKGEIEVPGRAITR
ncbi:hypothetical protein E2C01_075960 [Portunus trituberculatus]|uniref:Uncharacterized protein n=1 Tax=Portunus trituberculatus TaxID=210409 RepID=A0A5B7IA49_PORTR|nr:hypothetical protein [Portunus trituberculatus]